MKNILLVAYYTLPQKNACSDRANYIKSTFQDSFNITTLTVSNFGKTENEVDTIRLKGIYNWKTSPKKILYKLLTKIIEPFFDNIDYYWINNCLKFFKEIESSCIYFSSLFRYFVNCVSRTFKYTFSY